MALIKPAVNLTKAQTKRALDHLNAGGRFGVMDASSLSMLGGTMDAQSVQDNMAFLVGELEKIDPKLLEPLTNFDYPRDITLKPGGGWVQYASVIDVDYATTGGNEDGIVAPSSTEISRMQANLNKDVFQVHTFMQAYSVGFVNNAMVQQTGRSLEDIFDKGIKLSYNKALDKATYLGMEAYGSVGLVNNTNVNRHTVAGNGATPAKTTWADKTADQILADVNTLISTVWAAGQYSVDALINHILLPPEKFGYLVTRKVSEAGNISILRYVLENNLAASQGVDLKIFPSRFCIGAGTGPTDRMVGYVNEESKINIDVTVPLARVLTAPNISSASIDSIYAGQFSEVKLQYLQTIGYADGI